MLGNKGQHEVQLVIFCNTDDYVRIGYAFLDEEVDIRAIATDGNAAV